MLKIKNRYVFFACVILVLVMIAWKIRTSWTRNPPLIFEFSNLSTWKTYTNTDYGFSFRYPPELNVLATEGSSDFEFKYVSVDIGDDAYLQALKKDSEAEGLPPFLRIGADIPQSGTSTNRMRPDVCDAAYHLTEKINIDEVTVLKCEGKTMGDLPSLAIIFKKNDLDPIYYTFSSMKYEGTDKRTIDKILSTFRFIK